MSFFTRTRTFESLSMRDYRLLWLGQLTTTMGQWMDQTARSWLIYTLTGSALQLGFVSAVRGAPLLLFGVVAGVAADRYGKKAQLIIAQIVNAILNLVLATLIFTHHIEVWQVYVTGFLSGTVQAFQQPARQVLINELSGPKHLLNAIALNSAAFNVSRSLGPALCGIIIEFSGVDISYYVQAGFYIFATVWTFQMRVPQPAPGTLAQSLQNQSFSASAKEGLSFILANKLILALMILGLAPILLGMPYMSLMPVFALDVLHGTATTQGLLMTGTGIGAVIGALTIASLGRRQGSGKLLILGACGFGIGLVLFSRSSVLWMAMLFTFMAGLSNSAYTSQDQTIIQVLTPSQLRGRVLGIYFLNRGLMPLGSLIAGALAAYLGGPWAVTIMGSSCLLLAVIIAFAVPAIWNLKTVTGTTAT
jgi:MFS transporter, DHA1 family, staphyloferrin A biosynthesis exporter